MKREMRRLGGQSNYTQRNSLQGTYHKQHFNINRKQYETLSQNYYMYTSNAVVQDYSYEEERQAEKKKNKKKPMVWGQYIPTVFVVFLMAIVLVAQYAYIQNLGYQVSKEKTELKATLEQNEKVKKQIATKGELQAVEVIAVNQLGMHKPTNDEIVYLPKINSNQQEGTESMEAAENVGMGKKENFLVEYVKKYFNDISKKG